MMKIRVLYMVPNNTIFYLLSNIANKLKYSEYKIRVASYDWKFNIKIPGLHIGQGIKNFWF